MLKKYIIKSIKTGFYKDFKQEEYYSYLLIKLTRST